VEEDLLDIRAGVKAGRYVNEATVSQGIVQRLLNALGWPVYDTEIVSPEYSLGTRRADYALCHPPREPVIRQYRRLFNFMHLQLLDSLQDLALEPRHDEIRPQGFFGRPHLEHCRAEVALQS
jgi:hypothetical protein